MGDFEYEGIYVQSLEVVENFIVRSRLCRDLEMAVAMTCQ